MAGRWWHEQSHPGMEMGWVRFVLKGLFSAYDSSYREGKPGQTPLPGFERKTLSWGIWRASYTSPPVGAFWVVLCLPTEPGGSWMASDPLLHPFPLFLLLFFPNYRSGAAMEPQQGSQQVHHTKVLLRGPRSCRPRLWAERGSGQMLGESFFLLRFRDLREAL